MRRILQCLLMVAFALCARVAEAQCTAPTINGTEPTCTQTSYTFTTEAGMSAYNWTVIGGNLQSPNGTNTITVSWYNTGGSSVSVTYTKSGCSPATTQKNVTLLQAPPGLVTPPGPTVCSATPAVFTAPTGMTNYSWVYPVSPTPGANVTSATGQGTNALTTTWAAPVSGNPGSVVVRYLNPAANGCYSTGQATVSVYNPFALTITGPASYCLGSLPLASNYSTTAGYTSYTWTVTGGTISWQNNETVGVQWTTAGSGSISVVASGSPPCSSGTKSVNVFAQPAAPVISGPASTCVGNIATYTSTGSFSSYAWNFGLDGTATTGTTSSTIGVRWNNAGPQAILVKGTDVNGCVSLSSAQFNTTVNGPSITGNTLACNTSTGSYSVTAGLTGVTWAVTGGSVSGSGNNVSITWTTAGLQTITVNASGSSGGCTLSAPLKKTVYVSPVVSGTIEHASPPPPPVNNFNVCSGWSRNLAVVTPYGAPATVTWSVSPGSTFVVNANKSVTVTFNTVGTTTVTASSVTDANGCPVTVPARVITVDTPLPASVTPAGPIQLCAVPDHFPGGSAVLTASTGSNYSYTWMKNGVAMSVPNVNTLTVKASEGSANYNVVIHNGAGGCPGTSSPVSVTVNSLTTITVAAGGPTTFCAGGSVLLTASGGTGGAYAWTKDGSAIAGATSTTYTATATGIYTAHWLSPNGCVSQSNAMTVQSNEVPIVNTSTPYPYICSGGSSITITATGQSPFVWKKDGVVISGQTSNLLTVTTTGTYVASKTYASTGCTGTSVPIVVAAATSPTVTNTAAGPTTFCANPGATVTINATGAAGVPFKWTNNSTVLPDTGSSIVVSASGYYRAEQLTPQGCWGLAPAGVLVTVRPLPVVTLSAGSATTFCAGGSVVLTASGGTGSPPVYVWKKDNVVISGASAATYTANATGSYTASWTNSNGCTGTSAAIVVTANPLPVLTLTPGASTSICAGNSVTLTAAGGAVPYVWKKDGVLISGATASTYVANAAGAYTITWTNAAGCTNTSAATTVIVNALPTVGLSAGTATTFCQGGSVILTATGGATPYVWKLNGTVISGVTTASYTASAAGSYTAHWTNANGCTGASTAIAVTVNPLPTVTLTNQSHTTQCQGNATALLASGGAAPYVWKLNGSLISGATTNSYNAFVGGSYTASWTNGNGCTGTSNAITVTINPLPTVTISPAGPVNLCTGGSATLTASGGTTYTWKKDGVVISGVTGSTYSANSTGNYTATTSNGFGCPGVSAPVAVTLNTTPTVSISAGGPTTFCAGGSVTLTAGGGSAPYTWMLNGSVIGGATSSTYTANATGNYTASSTVNGCTGTSSPLGVTVNLLPSLSVSPSGSTSVCIGSSVTLTASGGSVPYTWLLNGSVIGGATASTYSASSSGNYSVSWTNGNGCSNSSNLVGVTINPLPTISITQTGPTTICEGNTSYMSVPDNGDTFYWYRNGAWISSSNIIAIYQSGNYHMVQQSPQGCSATSSTYAYTVNPTPTIAISPNNPSVCEGGYVAITANTVAGATVHWYTSSGQWVATGGQLVFSSAVTGNGGSYYAISNLNGCASTSNTSTLTVSPKTPTPTISRVNQCGTAILSSSLSANNYLWSNGSTASSITVSSTGTYTLQTLNNGSCWSDVASLSVTTLPTPSVTASRTGVLCPTGQVTLSAMSRNGTVVSYDWSHGQSGASVPAWSAGTYTVTVTYVGGCTASADVTVPAPPGNCQWLLKIAPEEQKPVSNSDASPIVEEPTISTTHISPNPASTEINIQISPRNYARRVSLVNMQGVTILDSEVAAGSSSTRIPLTAAAQGMYLVIIQSNDKTERHKVLIQK